MTLATRISVSASLMPTYPILLHCSGLSRYLFCRGIIQAFHLFIYPQLIYSSLCWIFLRCRESLSCSSRWFKIPFLVDFYFKVQSKLIRCKKWWNLSILLRTARKKCLSCENSCWKKWARWVCASLCQDTRVSEHWRMLSQLASSKSFIKFIEGIFETFWSVATVTTSLATERQTVSSEVSL